MSQNIEVLCRVTVKVKPSLKRLDRPLGLQQVETPRISKKSGVESGKAVNPTRRPLLPSSRCPLYQFLLQAESTGGM
jgi:hypothetical protein